MDLLPVSGEQRRRPSFANARRKSVAGLAGISCPPPAEDLIIIICDGTNSERYPGLTKQWEELNLIWEAEEPCDVEIRVGGRDVQAHRKVLSAYSPYFRAMFTAGLAETHQEEVELRDVDGAAVEAVINFAYSGRLTISQNNVQEILEVSSLLHLEYILEECCRLLRNELDALNCLGIAQFADMYSCHDLMKTAHRYACFHFREVASYEEYDELNVLALLKLLSSNALFAKNEEEVYQVALQWLKHDLPNRIQHLPEVLSQIRFSQMSTAYISRLTDAPSEGSSSLPSEIDSAVRSYVLALPKTEPQSPDSGGSSRPRHHLHDYLVCAGGKMPTGYRVTTLEQYDTATDTWTQFENMPGCPKSALGTTVMDGYFYVMGGTDPQLRFSSVHRYDPLERSWNAAIASMISTRAYHAVAVLGGYLYAIGGWNNDCIVQTSVERYDPLRNKWQMAPSMTTKRHGMGVAVISGILYVCGGNDGIFTLNCVECFDPRTELWTSVPSMTAARCDLGCCFFDGYLYAIGGNKHDSRSCERMDVKTQFWEPISSMNIPRSHGAISANVLDGLIYVVGGSDRNENGALEVYDPRTDTWSQRSSMCPPNRIDAAFTVVKI